jgi:hypothetical protein
MKSYVTRSLNPKERKQWRSEVLYCKGRAIKMAAFNINYEICIIRSLHC